MTGLIAIDESGDTGPNGSKFFVMAAIVTSRPRHLLRAYKATPAYSGPEIKFYDAAINERLNVLTEIANANVKIIYVCVDKEKSNNRFQHNNELYRWALKETMTNAINISENKDLNIIVDESSFIKNDCLKKMAKDASEVLGKNIKKCSKTTSDKCVRIADYVAGSIWAKYERKNEKYFEIINEKISIAHES